MTLHLRKFHGLGNDFLVALDEEDAAACSLGPTDAIRLCERRTGIGADGLIRGEQPPAGSPVDVVMHLWNSDGSLAEMSGNGIRCLAHAVLLARGGSNATFTIATGGGIRVVHARTESSTGASVRVAMGAAAPGPPIPDAVRARFDGQRLASVDVGNPHLVIEVADPWSVDIASDGAWTEQAFPAGVNVEFIAAAEPDSLDLVVWERGAGMTRACGTGATAAASKAHEWGLVGRLVTVRMPGGTAQVEVGAELTLIGPSELIARIAVEPAVGAVPA